MSFRKKAVLCFELHWCICDTFTLNNRKFAKGLIKLTKFKMGLCGSCSEGKSLMVPNPDPKQSWNNWNFYSQILVCKLQGSICKKQTTTITVCWGIHIRHKKCTESLLNEDYSVKLSDRRRRKIASNEASFFPRSPFSRPSHLVRVVSWEGCAARNGFKAFSVFCAIAAHGQNLRKQSASSALDGCVLLFCLS